MVSRPSLGPRHHPPLALPSERLSRQKTSGNKSSGSPTLGGRASLSIGLKPGSPVHWLWMEDKSLPLLSASVSSSAKWEPVWGKPSYCECLSFSLMWIHGSQVTFQSRLALSGQRPTGQASEIPLSRRLWEASPRAGKADHEQPLQLPWERSLAVDSLLALPQPLRHQV